MRWKSKKKNEGIWHRWFAWHPVTTVDDTRVWLETVERCQKFNEGFFDTYCENSYRTIESKDGK
jgi:hypothetical protein